MTQGGPVARAFALGLVLALASVASAGRATAGLLDSGRTLVLALEIDRDQARLLSYTVKPRAYAGPGLLAPARPHGAGGPVQVEVALLGPRGARHVVRVDAGPLCFAHPGDTPPHIEGDTILVHRESFLVELPEAAGFDQVEVATFGGDEASPVREPLAVERLDAARFTPAGGAIRFSNLAFAPGAAAASPGADAGPLPQTPGTVHWPEEYGDPDLYRVWGDEAEASKRINVVLVPDGYTYAQKATMETHASSMVTYFRGKRPYSDHDRFINYILVYAYSTESGTDQCDCSIVVDTAMNTRFPDAGDACGGSGNRCLYYGTGNGGPNCDPNTTSANISAAELRAPARDTTVVMVNTGRYGGCGGARAVYSAANGSATEVAVHELGHSLAGLADEYGGTPSCGSGSGYNVSTDSANGTWPEWIADLGAPRQGARYYDQCVYRPLGSCDMRSLNQPFCPVCNQRWALVFYGHARVNPTAPIESRSPASPLNPDLGVPTTFSVVTRLGSGPGVTNDLTWRIQGPGYPTPTTVATGTDTYTHSFSPAGTYTLTCEVVADTNFVKPVKNGANVDVATWTVDAGACDPAPTFAGIKEAVDLDPCASTGVEVRWDPAAFGAKGGVYEVRRDGLLVATVAGSPYLDLPGDSATHSYTVTAVSADCALPDGNLAAASATDRTAPASLPPMGNALVAARAGLDVDLRWTDEPGAESYEVGRSDAPDFSPPVASVGTAATGATGVLDAGGVAAAPSLRVYRLRQSRCGVTSAY